MHDRDLPVRILNEARQAFGRGDYAESLDKYLWFHHHALAHNEAMVGVRGSFAIAEWLRLGSVYPPALEALESIRTAALGAIQTGSRDSGQFRDLAAINRQTGRTDSTAKLFEEIAQRDPRFADECFGFARSALIQARKFVLARRFLSIPNDPLLASLADTLNSGPEDDREREGIIILYSRCVRELVTVLEGVGESEEAKLLMTRAADQLTNPEDRDHLWRMMKKTNWTGADDHSRDTPG